VCADFADANFESHMRFYRFVGQFAAGADVLDVGSGTGYGSAYLAQDARLVVGIDYSMEAVRFAAARYQAGNLEFRRMDAQVLEFGDADFDLVVSSENLEHLSCPEHSVSEVRRVLRAGGTFVVGTPNKEMFSPNRKPENPFHVKEFYFGELRTLLSATFPNVLMIENTRESKHKTGRAMRAERVGRGAVGLTTAEAAATRVGGRYIDVTQLDNTHSFIAICW